MTDAIDPVITAAIAQLVGKGRRALWVGQEPPIGGLVTNAQILDSSRDYRADRELAGLFDSVFLVEPDLSQRTAWPLIVDETLRMLRPRGGSLVLRADPAQSYAIHQVASLLLQRSAGVFRPKVMRRWPASGIRTYLIELNQRARTSGLTGITFGVITDGRQPARVRRFVDSVRAIRGIGCIPHEILVVGPPGAIDHVGSGALHDTRLVVQPTEFEELGWITRKKNLLIASAQFAISVVAHDRYFFSPGWLEALESFGADFDVVVPNQMLADGTDYPHWTTVGEDTRLFPVGTIPTSEYSPNLYVNGGIIVARTELLRQTGWNEMLAWADGEDVELTRRLQAEGVVPRHCTGLIAYTEMTRPDQVAIFERIRRPAGPRISLGIQPCITLGRRYPVGRNADGLIVERAKPEPTYDSIDGDLYVNEFSVRIPETRDAGVLVLRIETPRSLPHTAVRQLRANGFELVLDHSKRRNQTAAFYYLLDRRDMPHCHTFLLRFHTLVPVEPAQLHITVFPFGNRHKRSSTLHLGMKRRTPVAGNEWLGIDDWGWWSIGHEATLVAPIHLTGGDIGSLTIEAKAHLPRELDHQNVAVSIQDRLVGILQLTGEARRATLQLPPDLVLDDDVLTAGFSIMYPTPIAYGPDGEPGARLGIGLLSIAAARNLAFLEIPEVQA